MNKRLATTCFIIAILLASAAIQIPLHNRSAVFFDEGLTFNTAESILHGSIPYKDKAIFLEPGIYYFTALLYKIFGISYLVTRYAMAAVFAAAAIVIFLISRRIMAEWMAFLTAMVFVAHRVWAFHIWNMIGYATISIFFVAVALLMLMRFIDKPKLSTAMLVGVAVAIATMFKQDYGGFTAIGISLYLLIWPWLRGRNDTATKPSFARTKLVAAFVAGGVMVCAPIFAYFALHGALDVYIRNTIVILLTTEASRKSIPLLPLWPLFSQDSYLRSNLLLYVPAVSFRQLLWALDTKTPPGFLYEQTAVWDFVFKTVHYLPYVAIIGTAGTLVKRFRNAAFSVEFEHIAAVLAVSVSIFATQHQPYDFAHLMQMYLPIFVLVGYLVNEIGKWLAPKKTLYSIALALFSVLLVIYLWHTVVAVGFLVRTISAKLEGPRGGIYMEKEKRDVCANAMQFIQKNTSPQEPIFVLGYHGLFYFLAERTNPTRYECLWPTEPLPHMNEEIIDTIDRERVKYLVIVDDVNPAIGHWEEFSPQMTSYVRKNYAFEKEFGRPKGLMRIIILKRKPDRM